MKALRIGLLNFVPAKTGIVGTLFDPVSGKTADGTYKKRRNGVQFFDAKDRPWFFLVANKYNERFFVSTGESNGKIFYAFGLAEDVKNRIGLSYSKLSDLANEVWEKVVEGRELETNPPMYAHHLRERKTHGLSLKQMRRLYAMVSRGNQKAITFARNVLGIPFDETPRQVLAVVKHHVLDLAERRVRRNPYIVKEGKQILEKFDKRKDARDYLRATVWQIRNFDTTGRRDQRLDSLRMRWVRKNPAEDVTPVVFRTFRANNEVIALFPYEPGNNDYWTMMSYVHNGQHGIADANLSASYTRLSTPGEYAPLKKELEQIGYNLKVMKKIPTNAWLVRKEKIERIK